eukprot:TRINITY_DN1660_c0_g1_i15.p1 TRINITY_DN1660_c0_g1~~TRINITY_DN1660_c0_g1_i15.p1  ORF type:complete len:219 (+),score=40.73 TRINITY_DN1660_c0_g1_i15:151-807(+)
MLMVEMEPQVLPVELLDVMPIMQNMKENHVQKPVVSFLGSSLTSKNRVIIGPENTYTEWFKIIPHSPGLLSAGHLQVTWRRSGEGSDGTPVVTTHSLPSIEITNSNFSSFFVLPSHATVGVPSPLILVVENHTTSVQEFQLLIIENSEFFIAGPKQTSFTVPPCSSYKFSYTLFPLIPGRPMLPKFQISSKKFDIKLPTPLQDHYLSVKPEVVTMKLI